MSNTFYKIALITILIIGGLFGYIFFINEPAYIQDSLAEGKKVVSETISDNVPSIIKNIATSVATTSKLSPAKVILIPNVPFSPQAPFGEWTDPRQQDGCEEISAIIAMHWAKGEKLTKEQAKQELFKISDYEKKNFGDYRDTSAKDTIKRIFNGYYKYDKVKLAENIKKEDIINELSKGNLVIVPVNGQKVGNKNYTRGGPERHMIVVTGYDKNKNMFITNDPGTRKGENFRYNSDTFFNAIRDYTTGYHNIIVGTAKNMIVVSK